MLSHAGKRVRLAIVVVLAVVAMALVVATQPALADAPGVITTVAGDGAPTMIPVGIAVTPDGSTVYIVAFSGCRVAKAQGGLVTVIAGNGSCARGGADGVPATDTTFLNPRGLALDGAGGLYVSDATDCRIRHIDDAGMITTVAGNGTCSFSGDGGPATSAAISPRGDIAFVGGTLYIADTCRVRQVVGGVITSVAGDGSCTGNYLDGGPADQSRIAVVALAVDANGDIYVADSCKMWRISGGVIRRIAGTGVCSHSGDGGPATAATLQYVQGVSVDTNGNVFVSTYDLIGFFGGTEWDKDCLVQRISGGTIITVAGQPGDCQFGGDGGPGTSAYLYADRDVDVDGAGNVYIADGGSRRVRKLAAPAIPAVGGVAELPEPLVSTLAAGGDTHASWGTWADGGLLVVAAIGVLVRRRSRTSSARR